MKNKTKFKFASLPDEILLCRYLYRYLLNLDDIDGINYANPKYCCTNLRSVLDFSLMGLV